jgi:hypothetical protein
MGLLDDAIREHLDLKRKHGATEEDLRRQEVEALGPARRDFTCAESAQAAEPGAAEPADAAQPAPDPAAEPAGWLDDEPGGEPFDATREPTPVEAPEPVEPVAEVAESTLPEERPAPPAPAPQTEESPAPARRESQTPTEGFPALTRDDESESESESDEDEDVLEETPDFLQDTPEHDRLWFEQKPPRDFDFDG